jgi:hypothetical protein
MPPCLEPMLEQEDFRLARRPFRREASNCADLAARMQREIVEYATLSQAALQSTKIIAESLTQWKKVSDAPTPSD